MYTNVRTRKQLGLTLLRLSQLQKLRSDANTVVPWLSSKKKGCPIIWAEQALVPHSCHFLVSIQIAANVGVVLVVSKLLRPGAFRTPWAVLVGSNGTNLAAGQSRLFGVGPSQTWAVWHGLEKNSPFKWKKPKVFVLTFRMFKLFKASTWLLCVSNQKQKVHKKHKMQPFLASDTRHTLFHLPCPE